MVSFDRRNKVADNFTWLGDVIKWQIGILVYRCNYNASVTARAMLVGNFICHQSFSKTLNNIIAFQVLQVSQCIKGPLSKFAGLEGLICGSCSCFRMMFSCVFFTSSTLSNPVNVTCITIFRRLITPRKLLMQNYLQVTLKTWIM